MTATKCELLRGRTSAADSAPRAPGARFATYPVALTKLRRALIETLASGGVVDDGSLIERAFGN
jgi:hypothetical protein